MNARSFALGLGVGLMGLIAPALSAQSVTEALDYGPHAVGFRYVTELDHSRTVQARRTFDGKPIAGESAWPIEIGIWYPTSGQPAGTRMTAERYKSLRTQQDRAAAVAEFTRMAGFGGLQINADQAAEAVTRSTRAFHDATPAAGPFPVVIAGAPLGTSWIHAEYLASHGYVVLAVSTTPRTATIQATRPVVALDIHLRNLEYLTAFARRQPFVDTARLGIVGVNFDGMAALMYEMRNLRADAVISLDGYEAKVGSSKTVLESPYFDPLKMRSPYLVFVQDERDPPPSLHHDRSVWNALKYSTRFWYVLKEFNHSRLISDVSNAPTLTPEQQAGHRFVYRTMRLFLDAYVKKDAAAKTALEAEPVDAAIPAGLRKVSDRAIALPPAPTGEEFEAIVMSGDIARAAEVLRQARKDNPDVAIADEQTFNLFAFRYGQRKQFAEALELRKLAAETFPQSALSAYRVGLTATDAGRPAAEIRDAFDRALKLLDGATQLSQPQKDAIREDIRKRLEALAPTP